MLYQDGYNDKYMYIVLFGKLKLADPMTNKQVGQILNIGWTVGEEILFRPKESDKSKLRRTDRCAAVAESCVLGIEKKSLAQIKRALVERSQGDEYVKLEVVMSGNYLVKKNWR